jgi:hypothetical protein
MNNSKYEIDYSNRNLNDLRGEYDTALITVDSQINSSWSGYGYQTIDPITRQENGKSNAGFTTVLTHPIILDNNFSYTCSLSKISFDIADYSTGSVPATSFIVGFDQIEFQYYDGIQLQVLHKTQPVLCTNDTQTGQITPFTDEPYNLIYRYLNGSNKVLSRLTFTITDGNGNPLGSLDPTIPTQIQLVIKKVSPNQQY